jgi:hypothetical protein
MDFKEVAPVGPYKVGFTNIKTKKGNFIAVYYPVDFDEKLIDDDKCEVYHKQPEHKDRLRDFVKNLYWRKPGESAWFDMFLSSEIKIKMPIFDDALVAKIFRSNSLENTQKKLTPVIFSHDSRASACDYSIFCKEMASFGMIVFAIDHLD